jgi:acetyltransferase-like isoleucine patch superfamily enzyme
MPIRVDDGGSNNTVDIPATLYASMTGVIHIEGNNNKIKLNEGTITEEFYFHIGNRVNLEIGRNCRLGKLSIYTSCDNNLLIGSNASFTYETKFHMHEPSSLTIGQNALFSDGVYITTSDMHSIIDVETGHRLNYSKDVRIGDHVWLGMHVTVMKGSSIGSGSIIGACSVVAGDIPDLCIAAGQPARVTRRGVTWRPDLI